MDTTQNPIIGMEHLHIRHTLIHPSLEKLMILILEILTSSFNSLKDLVMSVVNIGQYSLIKQSLMIGDRTIREY